MILSFFGGFSLVAGGMLGEGKGIMSGGQPKVPKMEHLDTYFLGGGWLLLAWFLATRIYHTPIFSEIVFCIFFWGEGKSTILATYQLTIPTQIPFKAKESAHHHFVKIPGGRS